MSEVIHLKVFDICLLDVKSFQINQNLLWCLWKQCTKYKISSLCFRWLTYRTWKEFILKLLFYVCTLCFINIRKSGIRLSIHRTSKVPAIKVLTVFLIQGYIFPFIEYNWIVFQYIIKVKSQMDIEKKLVLCLQVLLFLLIEFEWTNYLLYPLKPTEIYLWLYDDFSGNRSLLIRTKLLKIKSKIW